MRMRICMRSDYCVTRAERSTQALEQRRVVEALFDLFDAGQIGRAFRIPVGVSKTFVIVKLRQIAEIRHEEIFLRTAAQQILYLPGAAGVGYRQLCEADAAPVGRKIDEAETTAARTAVIQFFLQAKIVGEAGIGADGERCATQKMLGHIVTAKKVVTHAARSRRWTDIPRQQAQGVDVELVEREC